MAARVRGNDVNARNTSPTPIVTSQRNGIPSSGWSGRIVGERHVGAGDRHRAGHHGDRAVDDDVHPARRRVDLAEAPARADRARRRGARRTTNTANARYEIATSAARTRRADEQREHADHDLDRGQHPHDEGRRPDADALERARGVERRPHLGRASHDEEHRGDRERSGQGRHCGASNSPDVA